MQTPISNNPQSTLLTLYDAITDSPIYRSTSLHFDDQLDLLEKWLESLSKYIKSYVEKLNKFNLETNTLCKKVIPVGIDDFMIDPNFTGAVIKSFSDALQMSLAFKTKLVSDLEDNIIQPLQMFIKTQLKEFKDFRKQHEKVLERYEAQLNKYISQNKTKEASAVREEAFRLYEARKSYVRMSGQHVVRILHFRSILEHFLVERFTLATTFHLKEFEGGTDSWLKLKPNLTLWKQWILDDKDTCNYQLCQLQSSRITMECKYLNNLRPARDLEKYNTTHLNNSRHSLDYSLNNQASCKWGYLFIRGARNYWTRRWFFLYDGCFGSVNLNPIAKLKGAITMGDRVSVLLCDIKPMTDIDRRHCFEVMCAHQPSFVLQAESENEMREWIGAFEKSKRLMLQNQQLDFKSNDGDTTPLTDKNYSMTSKNNLDNLAAINKPSFVILSSSPENDQQSTTSLTPLLIWEASRVTLGNASSSVTPSSPVTTQSFSAAALTINNNNTPYSVDQDEDNLNNTTIATTMNNHNNTLTTSSVSSWGIPWALVPTMFQNNSSSNNSPNDESNNNTKNDLSILPPASPSTSAFIDTDGHQVIWPIRINDSNIPKVELTGYHSSLEARNKELRHLFGGVGQNEVVLASFVGLLKKKPLHDPTDHKESETSSSPISANSPVDTLEQDFNSQLPSSVKEPLSNYGYAYTGCGYITQEAFWFYSCVMMNCVNTVAVRLCDIKSIRLVRDNSLQNIGTNSNIAIAIDLLSSNEDNNDEPLIFTTLMDDVEIIAEKLKFVVSNAKSSEPESLQTTYDVIHSMSTAVKGNKSSSKSFKTTVIKSATDPLYSTTTTTTTDNANTVPNASLYSLPLDQLSSTDLKKKLNNNKSPRKFPAPIQPKSGALAAAMMAATVAGGSGIFDARKNIIQQEDSSPPSSSSSSPTRHLLRNHKKFSATSLKSLNQKQQQENDEIDPTLIDQHLASPIPSKISDNNISSDISDTTQKPNNPFAPPKDFKIPLKPVSCECDNHLDKLEAEIEVPISAKHLYYILFSDDNPEYMSIWEKKTVENKSKELTMTKWQEVDGKIERTLKYVVPVNNTMVKLKEAEVIEKQVIERKDDYIRYVVLTSTKSAQLPYADAFVPYVKYCITWVSDDRSKLSCYTGVKFIKNVLVKGIISKAAMKGMNETMSIFMPIIKNEASKQTQLHKKDTNLSTLKRTATIKYSNATTTKTENDTNAINEKERTNNDNKTLSGWYGEVETLISMLKDFMDALPFTAKVLGAIAILAWLIYSWTFSQQQQQDVMTSNHISGTQSTVISRAVYLRDINEGLLNSELQSAYEHTESFRLFLETKLPNKTQGTHYRWFSSYHHQFATELLFSRERLAMLRHDSLVLFQLLNEIDSQLLENEYTNWLMDIRLHCRSPDVDYDALHCDEVKRQLRSLLIG
ncbi:uncharacterized protein BX663DRAFT_517696 [Cokeromyces recurvatus]|uniref:uncharacterized protein n=1 Tax=Cokeromyces recurvatus TaxID=90255 RepID=UPI00221F3B3E|nr:uncharacterized protein BX663DRAFT_517696 [Cokeromyces recurvatus]KAI7900458.1 hypothetical protein BX663DRAFT_517696 [Cokeromyces recurvatus]